MLGCAPTERIAADKAAMLALPPVAPVTGWRSTMAATATASPKISVRALNGLLELTIMEARS